MTNEVIKISNPNEFPVGLKLMDNIQERLIKPHSFVYLDPKEVYYIDSICSLFKKGVLIIDNEEINQNLGFAEVKEIASDEHWEKVLKGNNPAKLKTELAKANEKHIVDKVVSIAKKLDLSGSKLKAIEDVLKISIEDIVEEGKE